MLISRSSIVNGRGYRVNDGSAFLKLLLAATKKNVCEPREDEVFNVERMIRASGDLEGDSQIGVLLFIGIARDFGINASDIIDFLGIEKEQYQYKLNKYTERVVKTRSLSKNLGFYQEESEEWNTCRFRNKVVLIKTFLYFYARQSKVLFSKPSA